MRRRIRHARRWVGYGSLVVLILFAALVGVVNQLMPWVSQHPRQIATWLSQRVGQPIEFTHARAEWTRRGPRFTLDGLRVGRPGQALDIGRAELLVAIYSGLLPDHPLTELKVRDLALTLLQDDSGRWHAIGLPGQGGPSMGDPLDRLEGFGELQIEKAQLSLRSQLHDLDLALPRVDVRLRVYGDRLRVGASVWALPNRPPLSTVLELDRRSRDGRVWVGGERLGLTDWQAEFAQIGLAARSGETDLGVWIALRDQRVTMVSTQLDARDVVLESLDSPAATAGGARPLQAKFDRLNTLARWSGNARQWQLEIPQSRIERGSQTSRIDGLQITGGEHVAARARLVDLQALASLASLSARVPAKLRLFMAQAQPHAALRDLRAIGAGDHGWRGTVSVSSMGLSPSGDRPGVEGLGGQMRFDQDGASIALDGAPLRFNWPAGLRQPLDMRLGGTVGFWRDGDGWTLGATGLRLRGEDFGARARVEIGWQGDGSKPTLDLAADLDPASFDAAKKFWIMHKMPPGTVTWLDEALVSGDVVDGRIAIGGDLDDWPFRHHEGTFDARAHIRAATVHFSPEWPEAEKLDADVAFDGPGFSVSGSADLHGNPVAHVSGGIADFHAPWLDLDIDSETEGERLRALLLASPLNKPFGEHLQAVRALGSANVSVQLHLPLNHELGERSIQGSLALHDARLSDSRWGLLFTGVNGLTRFDQDGFATEDLAVKLQGQPGIFDLRVGPQAGEPGLAAIATLGGRFTPQSLISNYRSLDWLKPLLTGSSDWQLAVRIPSASKGAKALPAQLQVNSNLVGTAMTLPAPLAKTAGAPLAMELRTALPVEQGTVELRLGSLMRLRGALRGDAPINGSVQFGEGQFAPFPAKGLSVRGRLPLLDATGWIGFSAHGEGAATINDIDVTANQLNLIDRAFPDTRVQLNRVATGMQLRVGGPAIEGVIDVPSELSRGVQAKMTRFYLASQSVSGATVGIGASPVVDGTKPANAIVTPGTAASATPSTASAVADKNPVPRQIAAPTIDVDDPSKLPPLRFAISDLRLGSAQLGEADLVTVPTAAGMHIERFQTRAKALSLMASGDWQRVNGETRSSFSFEFRADSLGRMLDTLGFAGMVDGGKTHATLSGTWPGPPGAFSLANLTGQMNANIGEGRLLDVEPGGSGRILGLISLAEIPRRLSLDFSDFFAKGFAFNSARGDFAFSNGQAQTDNLHIDGPAAEIRVSGTTGLRDQSYDQRVEVLPKAGGVLPALGMLAGGPAGAAVGAVAQAVLQKPLKQSTRVVYRITGSWDKPDVEVIERGPPKEGAPAQDEAPSPQAPPSDAEPAPATTAPGKPSVPALPSDTP